MPREEDGDLPGDEDPFLNSSGSKDKERKPLEPRLINIGGKATVWMGKVRLSLLCLSSLRPRSHI
jgi:hypothetical protein